MYLLVAISLQTFVVLVRVASVLYRNVRYKKPLTRALIQAVTFKEPGVNDIPVSDVVHVHVKMSRSWKPRAGQYFCVCIPGVSYTSFMQSHPFYVSWWYRDPNGDMHAVFIIEKQRGFTRNLFLYGSDHFDKLSAKKFAFVEDKGGKRLLQVNNGSPNSTIDENAYKGVRHFKGYTTVLLPNAFNDESTMRTIIEGPYGNELHLDSYGTVLLFATGIGIAGQLPYVTQLLEEYLECKVKTRRIALFWEVESERKLSCKSVSMSPLIIWKAHTAWVAQRFQELLKQDTGRVSNYGYVVYKR